MHSTGHFAHAYRYGLVINPNYYCLGASPHRNIDDAQSDTPFGLIEVKYLGRH